MAQTEAQLHEAVCNYISLVYPEAIFNTDLSGIKLPMGLAKKVTKLRSSKGFPDIVIYERTNEYNALFIKLKWENEKLYKRDKKTFKNEHLVEQFEMINKLKKRGYLAVFCVGFDEARKIIDNYMLHLIS